MNALWRFYLTACILYFVRMSVCCVECHTQKRQPISRYTITYYILIWFCVLCAAHTAGDGGFGYGYIIITNGLFSLSLSLSLSPRTKYNQSKRNFSHFPPWLLHHIVNAYRTAFANIRRHRSRHQNQNAFYYLFIDRRILLFAPTQAHTAFVCRLLHNTNKKQFNICIEEFCFM